MDFSLKPHPLVAHWTPGMVVLSLLTFSHFNWSYKGFTKACAGHDSSVTVTVLFMVVGAFFVGEILDCIRDLLEEKVWKQKVNWYYFVNETPEKTEQFNDYFFTYYVLNMNSALAMIFSGLILIISTILTRHDLLPFFFCSCSMSLPQLASVLGACLILAVVFFSDAKELRYYVARITNGKTDQEDQENQVPPHEGVYTRIKPSKLNGVGVFAIRKISKDTNVFQGDGTEMVWIKRPDLGTLLPEIRRLYEDFAVIKKNGTEYGCPKNFNMLTVGWYLNEDRQNPNVRCDRNYEFFALRDIEPGEELTVDYSTYSELPNSGSGDDVKAVDS